MDTKMILKCTLLISAITIFMTACATKRYPICTPMSSAEASLMTCRDLEIELVKLEEMENKIKETGEFDGKTVLGFLGDFGIGNAMAKSEAKTALEERRKSICEAQKTKGCIKTDRTEKGDLPQDE